MCQSQLVIDFASGKTKKYIAQKEPKAKGIDFSIEYPAEWVSKAGEHPNIVQKFGNEDIWCSVAIYKSDINFDSLGVYNELDFEYYKTLNPKLQLRSLVKDLKIESLDADKLEYLQVVRKLDQDFYLQTLAYYIYHEHYIIHLGFSVGGLQNTASLKKRFDEHLPLFNLMANSFILTSLWRK